jgi:transcriptional regulator with XRE-family HTH domain
VKLRLKKGWTQEKLAFESEMSKAGMCVIESGQRSPTIKSLEKIASALDVPIVDLFK